MTDFPSPFHPEPLRVHSGLTSREQGLSLTQVTPIHNQAANGALINVLMIKTLFMEH